MTSFTSYVIMASSLSFFLSLSALVLSSIEWGIILYSLYKFVVSILLTVAGVKKKKKVEMSIAPVVLLSVKSFLLLTRVYN